MGKKAYLYWRNYEAVDKACIMYSLFGACKVLGKEDLHKLLPEEWEEK